MEKAHIDQDKATCEPVELGKKLSVARYISADEKCLGASWAQGPGGLEQPTSTLVNSRSLNQGVCMQIVRCLSFQIVARIYLEEF